MTQIDTPTHAPSKSHDKDVIPRFLVRAMFALVMTVLVLVTFARLTEMPVVSKPPTGNVLVERTILLKGDLSGAALVQDIDGTVIADMAPDEGGFVSGVWRVIARERTKHRLPLDGPVVLQRHDTGRISIHDPSTGWHADLMGFGIDNARVFARLLE